MGSLRDALGRELRTGQTVAVAQREGNVAALRCGIIEDVGEDTVTIRWTTQARYGGPAKSTLAVEGKYVSRPRIVVVR